MKQLWEAMRTAAMVLTATGLLLWARGVMRDDAFLFLVKIIVSATAILLLAHLVNRRDDPREKKRPPDTP